MAPKGVVSMLPPDRGQHKRTKSSSSMIKSIISSKAQKKTQSEDVDARAQTLQHHKPQYGYDNGNYSTPILPADHPHAEYAVLGEIANHDNGPASPRKSSNEPRGRPDSLYMRTKSSESTTTLDKEKGKDPKRSRRHKEEAKPKKSKSATSLTSLFTKNRSAKDLTQLAKQPRDKENTTPPSSATANGEPVTPIWAHYATQFEERSTTTKIPLNDASRIKRELELYNPTEYSPSKQKDYFGMEEPKLAKRSTRPKSVEIAANSAKALFQSAARKSSDEPRMKGKEERRTPSRPRPATSNSTPVLGSRPTASVTAPSSPAKRGTRVMAAVANLNDKTKEAEVESLDPKNVDAAFEAVLESRNIPEAQRQKMRTLKLSLKVDFIRSHKVEGVQTPTEGTPSEKVLDKDSVNKDVKKSSKSKGSLKNAEAIVEDELDDRPETPKRSRPRSRTFTFSKSDKGDSSSSKKAKGAERDASTHRKDKSVNIPKSPSTTSLAGTASAGSSIRSQAPKTTAPDEFVQYIHSAMRLQNVEVGRLHKLRLLLRNETVAWVDSFIREGGMTEIVALLHRIMEVEWREEHEDALLHEALLCLKGLCTTDLALQKLCEVESTLFPALLAMLFDKERKGPSEFNTRGIIVNMLCKFAVFF